MLLPVPLLPGESVQTPGVQVEAGQVKVALAPGQVETGWSSSLAIVPELRLTAPEDTRLAESWMLDVSALWHLDAQGIPPVHQRGESQGLLPSWRPLPGETLELHFAKPAAVPGPTLTIDQVDYRVEPGRRGSEATLTLGVRSSRGGRHSVRLPDGARLRLPALAELPVAARELVGAQPDGRRGAARLLARGLGQAAPIPGLRARRPGFGARPEGEHACGDGGDAERGREDGGQSHERGPPAGTGARGEERNDGAARARSMAIPILPPPGAAANRCRRVH